MTIANDSKIMNENEYKMNISTRSYDCTLYNVHTEECIDRRKLYVQSRSRAMLYGQIHFSVWTNMVYILINKFYKLNKQVLQFRQLHFTIWTNTFYTVNHDSNHCSCSGQRKIKPLLSFVHWVPMSLGTQKKYSPHGHWS